MNIDRIYIDKNGLLLGSEEFVDFNDAGEVVRVADVATALFRGMTERRSISTWVLQENFVQWFKLLEEIYCAQDNFSIITLEKILRTQPLRHNGLSIKNALSAFIDEICEHQIQAGMLLDVLEFAQTKFQEISPVMLSRRIVSREC
jgi:hypothetical protein